MPNLHFFPDLMLLAIGAAAQGLITLFLDARPARGLSPLRAKWLWPATGASLSLLVLGYFMGFRRLALHFPVWWSTWLQGASLIWAVIVVGSSVAALGLWSLHWVSHRKRRDGSHWEDISRRGFLRATGATLFAAPMAVAGFGILERNRFELNQTEIPIVGLPKELDGLRIAQITDIHLSAFLSEREFARAVDMANETLPHLALVTGDLITRRGDPLDACLRQLARLKAGAGVLGCLGNHEIYTGTEAYVTEKGRGIGIEFLRMASREVRFGGASIQFAGVDYQRSGRPYLVGAETLIVPGRLNVLLSHNPDVFPVAARQGYALTIAGHTHGGQVNVEILNDNLNLARFYTPFTRGLYRLGDASIFVSSGIGTVGMPMRLGAPAEVNLIRLRRAEG